LPLPHSLNQPGFIRKMIVTAVLKTIHRMRFIIIVSLLVSAFASVSCGSLKKASKHPGRTVLNDSTFSQLKGKYNDHSPGKDSLKESLYWDIFDRGINPSNRLHYIELEPVGNSQLKVSCWDGLNRKRSKVFRGQLKDNYFIFRRRYDMVPVLLINLFRGRAFRIGMLENGNLITDYHQLSAGTFYVLVPYVEHRKSFGVEFDRIQ